MFSPTMTQETPQRRVRRVTALLVALLGLFAMHGLADHGTSLIPSAHVTAQHAVEHTSHAMRGHSMDAHAGSSAGGALAVQPTSSDEVAGPSTGVPSHGGHGSNLLGLCLAVLVAALALGIASWLRRRRWMTLAARAQALLAWSMTRVRDPIEPDLSVLSILRC